MQIVVMLLVVLAIAASFDTRPQDRAAQVTDQGGAIATQMSWYHNQAVRQCSPPVATNCPAGIINVPVSARQPGAAIDAQGYFQSGTDGTSLIVTTWVPANIGYAKAPMQLGGIVAAALRTQTMGSVYSGAWNATSQTINGTNQFEYGTIGHPQVTVPASFGGLNLIDGSPVLATVVN